MAKILLKLAAEDAERLGVAELEYDPSSLRFPEVRELKRQVGLNFPEFGKLCQDPNEQDYARGVIAWLALLRAGRRIPFEEFDLDVRGLVIERDEVAEDPNSSAPNGANES